MTRRQTRISPRLREDDRCLGGEKRQTNSRCFPRFASRNRKRNPSVAVDEAWKASRESCRIRRQVASSVSSVLRLAPSAILALTVATSSWVVFGVGAAVVSHVELSGSFETPNYSSKTSRYRYPSSRDDEWKISLQKGESVTFYQSGAVVQFSDGDYFKLFVNGTDKGEFSTRNKSGIWATVDSPEGVTAVSLKFHSDSSGQGRGLRGTFNITCISDAACHNVGKCRPRRDAVTGSHAGLQCECDENFAGERCEVFADCFSLNCPEGTRCVKGGLAERPFCVCGTPGFMDDSGHCVDIDECSNKNGQESPCGQGNVCINTHGSYTCECPAGYVVEDPGVGDDPDGGQGAKCVHAGCVKPWIHHGESCYFVASEVGDYHQARNACLAMNATLVSIRDPGENSFLGLHAVRAVTWIGLSDANSEREWKWESGEPTNFQTWGPEEPSGSGDYAVLYPNQWAHSTCSTKSARFLCQASSPNCPANWWKDQSTGKCYYHSNYPADFDTARKICKYLANGGDLATPTAEEAALVLRADFWRNSADDSGLAHFWIGLRLENSSSVWTWVRTPHKNQERGTYEAEPEDTCSSWDSGSPTSPSSGLKMHYPRCAFLFPNKWSDRSRVQSSAGTTASTSLPGSLAASNKPGYICRRAVVSPTASDQSADQDKQLGVNDQHQDDNEEY